MRVWGWNDGVMDEHAEHSVDESSPPVTDRNIKLAFQTNLLKNSSSMLAHITLLVD